MAPTRRSTRAKSTDKGVAGPSPSTRAARARPGTKTDSPAVKPRTKQPRKTTSKAQTVLEVEEKEEEEEEENVQEKQKPKAKSTRRGVAKAQTVSRAGAEEEEEKEVISQEEIEDVVAATTRRSNRAASVASLQTPTKSKAARGRVSKKVAPARKIRGAVVEEEVAPEETHTKTSRGRKPLIETTNSPVPTTSTEILDAVVVRSRSKRQDAKKLKNLIEEPVVAEGSVDTSATPSWAKKRGGKKAKVVEDEAADSNLDQHTEAEMELAKLNDVEDTRIQDTEPEPVVVKGRGRKKGMKVPQGEAVVEELETTIEVVKPEPAPKGRGSRRGKKAEAVPEEPAEEIAVGVAEPELVPRGKSKRGKKADTVPEETVIEDTTIEVAKPEPAPKGRGGKKGKKVDAVSEEPEVIVEVAQPEPVLKGRVGRRGKQIDPVTEEPEDIIEETDIVAETEPAPKGRSKRGKKVDAVPDTVPEDPGVVNDDTTIKIAKPEPAPKGRGSRRGNKIDAVLENAAVDPEPVVAKGKVWGKGKKVVEEIEAVAEEPESVVEEPRPVPVKGAGRKKGKKVDTVVAEPEPVAEDTEPEPVVAKRKGGRRAAKAVEGTEAAVEVLKVTVEDTKIEVAEPEPLLPKGRGRNRGKQAVQVEITDTNVNRAVVAGTEIEKADSVVDDIEATSQEPQIVGDTRIMATEEPAVKSKVRRGKKVVQAKKGTRGGRKVVAELPDVEMSDTDVQTQETEVDVEMEPITATTTGPSVKDSGVFLESESMVGGPSVDKPEHITEGSNVTAAEELAVAAETEIGIVVPGLNVVSEGEPIFTMQSEVTAEVDTEITAIQPVVVGSSTGQIRAIAVETEAGVAEPSNILAKSPGSSRKKTPRGKETTQIIVPVEQDVEMGEPSVGGEKYGPNIELEPALEKSSTDIGMPVSDIGIELKEAVRAPKPRKKAKKPTTAIRRERQAKSVAKKIRGSSGGFEALDTSSDIFFDGIPSENIEKEEVKGAEGEEVMAERELVEEAEDEEGEPDLPQPFSSPVAKPTIILSPRRASPDPDLDPIKTPVPSSPIDHRMSHPLKSSPLRQNGPDPVVLASPRMVTTPSNSPSKKRSTPNTRTPINRLPGSGIPFGRSLEDSRDVRSISTPARGRNSSVASSPIMMPPATPNVVAGDARSPTKQTPTKESIGDILDRVDEPSMLMNSITNINSSPVKNSTPIRTGSGIERSSPVGRLNFGGSDISQSSPLVGRLQINDPSLLLSSPLAVPSKTFSPTKTQQNSPTRSSPLKHSPLGKPNYSLNFVCYNLTLCYDSNGFYWIFWG